MAGLYHDFLLLSRSEHLFSDYMRFINDPRAVHLHDDLVGYMLDTLAWVSAHNPSTDQACQGLCRHGPTVIDAGGAPAAARIFAAWADLLGSGPAVLRLTGEWSWRGEGPSPQDGYEQVEFERDEVVGALRRLAAYAQQVAGSSGDLYILHSGI